MGCNLKYAVSRCINYGLTGFYMFFTQYIDNFGAAGGIISQNFPADGCFEFSYEFFRKSIMKNRKWLIQYYSCHFPMTGGGIFTWRFLSCFSECSQRFFDLRNTD